MAIGQSAWKYHSIQFKKIQRRPCQTLRFIVAQTTVKYTTMWLALIEFSRKSLEAYSLQTDNKITDFHVCLSITMTHGGKLKEAKILDTSDRQKNRHIVRPMFLQLWFKNSLIISIDAITIATTHQLYRWHCKSCHHPMKCKNRICLCKWHLKVSALY